MVSIWSRSARSSARDQPRSYRALVAGRAVAPVVAGARLIAPGIARIGGPRPGPVGLAASRWRVFARLARCSITRIGGLVRARLIRTVISAVGFVGSTVLAAGLIAIAAGLDAARVALAGLAAARLVGILLDPGDLLTVAMAALWFVGATVVGIALLLNSSRLMTLDLTLLVDPGEQVRDRLGRNTQRRRGGERARSQRTGDRDDEGDRPSPDTKRDPPPADRPEMPRDPRR